MPRSAALIGNSIFPQAVFAIVREYGLQLGFRIQPHDMRRTCAKLCRGGGGELEEIQLLPGHASIQTTERYLGVRQNLVNAPNDRMGVSWRSSWTFIFAGGLPSDNEVRLKTDNVAEHSTD